MTKELFEKAKFGDRFVTRGGKEALFLRLTENSEWQFADFYVKDWGQIRVNRENGKCLNGPDIENDIVGMMPSLPSDLDEAAEEGCKTNNKGIALSADKKSHYLAEGKDAFKAGAEWMAGKLDSPSRNSTSIRWKRIRKGERLPCYAYLWSTTFENKASFLGG